MHRPSALIRVLVLSAVLGLVAACTGTASGPSSGPTGGSTPGASPSGALVPTAPATTPSTGPAGSAGPAPSTGPTAAASPPPGAASLPVKASAYGSENVPATAPTSDGGLYIAVPGGCEDESDDEPCRVTRTATIADTVPHAGSWADPYIPRSPLFGPDGSVWVVAAKSAWAWDPRGRLRPGWPFRMTIPLGQEGYCGEPCTVDCYPVDTAPFLDRAGTLYLLRAPLEEGGPGSVLAVGLDGKPVPGWPVQLKRAGAEPWYGSVGPDGTVFVEVYEPEPAVPQADACHPSASETTLALRPDGTVRYRVTLVDP